MCSPESHGWARLCEAEIRPEGSPTNRLLHDSLEGDLVGEGDRPDEVLGVLGGVGQLGHLQAVVALEHSGHRLVTAARVEGGHAT